MKKRLCKRRWQLTTHSKAHKSSETSSQNMTNTGATKQGNLTYSAFLAQSDVAHVKPFNGINSKERVSVGIEVRKR